MTSSPSPSTPPSPGLARRLFEVCGIAPLAVYALVHVGSYAQVVLGTLHFGAPSFQGLELSLEIALVWLPWLFHAGFGLWLMTQPLPELSLAQGMERRRAALSRVTATLSLVFVIWHVAWLRGPIWQGVRAPEDVPQMLMAGFSETWHGVPVTAAAHLIGIGLVATHLGLGTASFLERGELTAPRSARRLAWCLALGLFTAGAASVLELATADFPPHFLY